MAELEPCKFAYEIIPGRQSRLQYAFDVRHLDLDATSQAEGQAGETEYSARRIACGEAHGFCVSYVGMSIHHVEIVSPTPEDLDRALVALRQAQAACLDTPGLSD
ncbi:hypothetical protein [Maricaulis sp.]|uniref:hypothetical protein n=1 Tax=Maricaulis sp. TaxID=1486257 RepID=UPI0025B9F7D1|nr:hypothetical protein [Maricaulis sp.]